MRCPHPCDTRSPGADGRPYSYFLIEISDPSESWRAHPDARNADVDWLDYAVLAGPTHAAVPLAPGALATADRQIAFVDPEPRQLVRQALEAIAPDFQPR